MRENNTNSARKASKRLVAGLVAAFIVVAGAGSAYAVNLGGIQRTIQLWRYGEQTDAVLTIDTESETSHYVAEFVDENGETKTVEGGGIAYDMFGRERPLTEDEIVDHLDTPVVIVGDDGTATVYWHDQCIDIADKFDENGVCYVMVEGDGKTFYITAHNDGSYLLSSDKYIID